METFVNKDGKILYVFRDIKTDVYLTEEQLEKLQSASKYYGAQSKDPDTFSIENLLSMLFLWALIVTLIGI